MKKISVILFLFPFLLAMQCEADENSGFETTYYIENSTGIDLFYLTASNNFINVPEDGIITLASELNSETLPIPPSQSLVFNSIKLYKNENESFILVYAQNPIDDELWVFMEPTENRFEYKLEVTEMVLD
ncbi:hypothetical protein J4050_06885 [Winogradskyella sp. DF17]|uniref:Lipoprotein n=1 Tax=Winogradskyella pelagia TaxID=2819984 RepID=A0ABS3T142_9FLAO|nr:hypothetical protein [Winogradskyella sp. DF17]MBO3116465.1 hypothetical protein [Winogradskyella sp. DF17]